MYKTALKYAGFAGLSAITLLLALLSLHVGGWKAMSVQTGSMRPAINPGDMVLVKSVPTHSLKVGDVITYVSPKNKKQTITHRIVAIKGPQVTAKGDANQSEDPVLFSNSVVGVQQYKIPLIGYLLAFLRTWLGLALIVYIPALTIITSELRRLAAYYREQQPYVAVGYIPPRQKRSIGQNLATASKVLVFMLVCSFVLSKTVQAALTSQATLTNNTISSIGNLNQCPAGSNSTNTNVNVNGSGGNNNVNVNSTTTQNSTTGNTSSSGGGTATSGNASNTSCTNINVTITNNQ